MARKPIIPLAWRPLSPARGLLALLGSSGPAMELEALWRTLLHAAVVGMAAGAVGSLFFVLLEYMQRFLLQDLAGYRFLRAHGETFAESSYVAPFRWWLLIILPALGGLATGFITRWAPEARGGGGDQMIDAFHNKGGLVRRRLMWVKTLASAFTLGTGGAGGREGPTMLVGASIGSTVGQALKVSARERRLLMVAGVAAGMAAVFRTPLGAALFAVEVLYRDDFESDALIPAVLASVVAYSIVISIFGESTMFAHAPRYPFHAVQLPLYGLMAVLIALLSARFVESLRTVQRWTARLPGPEWIRPGVGGLALGLFTLPVLLYFGWRVGSPGQGLGLLGGGYGAAQMAITGSEWLPLGWRGVELLLLLFVAKLFAASLTIGTGGSAGDFAPSLALGGIFGGAFGRVAQMVLHDPSIDPGAFALVGMGTFYGGIAHVPLSALILVSELAGSYDLLVPLMLSGGIAFIMVRKHALYHAQVATRAESAVHRRLLLPELMRTIRVRDVMRGDRVFVSFSASSTAAEVLQRAAEQPWQMAFPVLDQTGALKGIISADTLRVLTSVPEGTPWALAADLMQPAVVLSPDDDLSHAARVLLANDVHELPVVDGSGHVLGFLDEAETTKAYVEATTAPPQ